MAQIRIAVVSDVHVYSRGQVPSTFPQLIAELVKTAPTLLVSNGDATVGNPDDGCGAARVESWWAAYKKALEPCVEAGIPIATIAGNHDYYTELHQKGYAAAWANLDAGLPGDFLLRGQPPLYYSLQLGDVFLLFLHTVSQRLEDRVEAFLRAELSSPEAMAARVRLAFGHVPLISVMGKTSTSFRDHLGGLLAGYGVTAYVSGHEHLVWDEELHFPSGSLRQILVGTASGTYHYPLTPELYKAHCKDGCGRLPGSGRRFKLLPDTRQQADKVTTTLIDIELPDDSASPPSVTIAPYALRDGALVPFGIDD